MSEPAAGYREIEHTADWELEVWAPSLPALLEQAARGMYALSHFKLGDGPAAVREFELKSIDREQLLVGFLAELLYYAEQEALGFTIFNLTLEESRLEARLEGLPIISVGKEIKAVTYHNLNISEETSGGFRARVVFDV